MKTILSLIDFWPSMLAMELLFFGLLWLGYYITSLFGADETEDDDDWPNPPPA